MSGAGTMKPTAAMSPETMTPGEKRAAYLALLRKWQKTINLVGPQTLDEAERRHFDDSLQLAALVPAGAKILFDLGSGAGFPGLVIALARPDIDVRLIESDARKCSFLSAVSRETETKVSVFNGRIETAPAALPVPDVVTARALAPLEKLLDYCLPWVAANPDLLMIFPKGAQAEEEVAAAEKKYAFSVRLVPSITGSAAKILLVTTLRPSG